MVDKKHIVKIKGKDFISFAGVLEEAHSKGVEDLRITELNVDWEKQSAYCIAACKIGDKEFMGAGSGTQANCGSMVKNHFVEMSQTRAFARCLKYALNLDCTCTEEMTDTPKEVPIIATEKTFKGTVKTNDEIKNLLICSKCKAEINEKVSEYSVKNFSKPLCFSCQKEVKAKDE